LPSKRPADRFKDIVENIDAIGRHTGGMTEQRFLQDEKTIDATLHCLLRISEAAKKLGALAKELAPDQPWADIRGIGNWLRHEYDVVDHREIWHTVVDDLPSLRTACKRAIRRIRK
jgi:uncharacterized protein with HEPN domain